MFNLIFYISRFFLPLTMKLKKKYSRIVVTKYYKKKSGNKYLFFSVLPIETKWNSD